MSRLCWDIASASPRAVAASWGISTGIVFEQAVQITDEQGNSLQLRRIVVQLQQPTRHGETEVAILTQLPIVVNNAIKVTPLYLEHWSIEGMFHAKSSS